MRVIISPTAHKNVREIYNYISYDSIHFAQITTNNIYSCIRSLQDSPYIGRYIPELSNKKYREILYKSYRIVYSVSEDTSEIYILFIIHGARNFIKIFNSYMKNIFKF